MVSQGMKASFKLPAGQGFSIIKPSSWQTQAIHCGIASISEPISVENKSMNKQSQSLDSSMCPAVVYKCEYKLNCLAT